MASNESNFLKLNYFTKQEKSCQGETMSLNKIKCKKQSMKVNAKYEKLM